MTPYADDDEECKDEQAFPDHVGQFTVVMMLVSDTFNPYSYHETGQVQTTSRFEGDYTIDSDGYYTNVITLKSDVYFYNYFYTNINNVKYNDGFMFGQD